MCGITAAISFSETGLVKVPHYDGKFRLLSPSCLVKENLDYLQHRGQDSVGIASSRLIPNYLSNKLRSKEEQFIIYNKDGSREILPVGKVDFDVMSSGNKHYLFSRFRNLGMINDLENFSDPSIVELLKGDISIGATRYGTTGKSGRYNNAQPQIKGLVAAVMNGDIINAPEKREFLKEQGYEFSSTSDVEDLAAMLDFNYRVMGMSPYFAVKSTMEKLNAGLFGIAMFPEGLAVFSDENHIRPGGLVIREDSIIAGSETSCISNVFKNYDTDSLLENWIELNPGEILFFERAKKPGVKRENITKISKKCFFEAAYFSRPDAFIKCNGKYKTVEEVRWEIGRELAYILPEQALSSKFVVPVLTSADFYAVGLSYGVTERKISSLLKSNPRPSKKEVMNCVVPYDPLLILNKYVPRTFIMPPSEDGNKQAVRVNGVDRKHSFSPMLFEEGEIDILIADDSIVRNNTQKTIRKKIRRWGNVRKVNLAIAVPPVKNPCYYAIDFGTELPAKTMSVEEIRESLNVDTLTFGTIPMWKKVVGESCWGCVNEGIYPTEISAKRNRDVFEK